MDPSVDETIDMGDDLSLSPVSAGDASTVLTLIEQNYGHLRMFMEWAKPDYSIKDAEEWVDRAVKGRLDGSDASFLILRGETVIGTIGFAYFDHDARVTEIGYWIDRNEQGRGIVTQACRCLLELAFRRLEMNRVQIRCADANVRSAAIPERLGFRKEGVQRQHVMRDGKIYDFLIYGLLKDEWEGFDAEQKGVTSKR